MSIAADRGSRYLVMGYSPKTVQEITKAEIDKFSFFQTEPEINISNVLISESSFNKIQISLPIDWPFGMQFVLVTTSHAI